MSVLASNRRDVFSTCRKDYQDEAVATKAAWQQETDYRIANGVQFAAALLRHEGRRITGVAEAQRALTEAADRLSAIAHMHRQLSQSPPDREVELTKFINPFCKDITQSTGVKFDVTSDDVKLRADVAGQICIILNELATNARKHGTRDGAPVTLALKVMRDGIDGMCLLLRDNGRCLPDGFSLQETSGLGMIIVTSTVEKLGGYIHAFPGPGARFRIDLPATGPRVSNSAMGRFT